MEWRRRVHHHPDGKAQTERFNRALLDMPRTLTAEGRPLLYNFTREPSIRTSSGHASTMEDSSTSLHIHSFRINIFKWWWMTAEARPHHTCNFTVHPIDIRNRSSTLLFGGFRPTKALWQMTLVIDGGRIAMDSSPRQVCSFKTSSYLKLKVPFSGADTVSLFCSEDTEAFSWNVVEVRPGWGVDSQLWVTGHMESKVMLAI